MSRTASIIIGPQDHGRRMSLDDFDTAEAREGRLYELSRGVINVTDVPNEPHGAIVDDVNRQLNIYRHTHPGVIHRIAAGSDCKLLIEGFESERHPDLAVYKTAPPETDVWSTWIPELVIEVVSADSGKRDYEEKPPEYLAFGVQEYWILDRVKGQFTSLVRTRGRWAEQVIRPPQSYRSRLLPGLELELTTSLTG